MTSLLDARSIICIDIIFGIQPTVRHDICAFEDHSGLDSILQCCIEFVLSQPKTFFQMEKHDSGWRITVENWEQSSRLLITHYDAANQSITWKNILAQNLSTTEVHPSAEAVKHYPQILGDSELVEDHSKIPFFTRQIYQGRNLVDKSVIEQEDQPSVTEFAKRLVNQLGSKQSIWFRVDEYPYFEIQDENKTVVRYWLVKETSVE